MKVQPPLAAFIVQTICSHKLTFLFLFYEVLSDKTQDGQTQPEQGCPPLTGLTLLDSATNPPAGRAASFLRFSVLIGYIWGRDTRKMSFRFNLMSVGRRHMGDRKKKKKH